ncbi:MAG: hypothetical protein MI867_30165, partial [Pseudomonadales bacterium]|nr:hypothetical protein [Pseudomonadales bacterium]
LENINNYWVTANQSGGFEYNRGLVNQVSISAEEELYIVTQEQLINASAVIRVNQSEKRNGDPALLSIQSNVLSNERYRTEAFLEFVNDWDSSITYEHLQDDGRVFQVKEESEAAVFTLKTKVNSPPGLILSMGDFQISGTGFVNNTAYFEVFGDAHLVVDAVNSLGVLLTEDGHRKVRQSWLFADDPNNSLVVGGWQRKDTILEDMEGDSLFYIHGNAYGDESSFKAEDISIFDEFLAQAEDWILAQFEIIKAQILETEHPQGEIQFTGFSKRTTDNLEHVDKYKLSWKEKLCQGTGKYGVNCQGSTTTSRSETEIIYMWDVLMDFWEDAKTAAQNVYDEYIASWWNE